MRAGPLFSHNLPITWASTVVEDTMTKYICKTFAGVDECDKWQRDHPLYEYKLVTCKNPYIVVLEMSAPFKDAVPINSTITRDEFKLDSCDGLTPKCDSVDYIEADNFDDTMTADYSTFDNNYEGAWK